MEREFSSNIVILKKKNKSRGKVKLTGKMIDKLIVYLFHLNSNVIVHDII